MNAASMPSKAKRGSGLRSAVIWTGLILALGGLAVAVPHIRKGLRFGWASWRFERRWQAETFNVCFGKSRHGEFLDWLQNWSGTNEAMSRDVYIAKARCDEVLGWLQEQSGTNMVLIDRYEMWNDIDLTMYGATPKEIFDEVVEQFELSTRLVPPDLLLVYPSDSLEIEKYDAAGLRWGPGSGALRHKLSKRCSVEFVDQPIDECFRYLDGFVELQLEPAPDVWTWAPGGCDPNLPITLHLPDASLEQVYDALLRLAGLLGEVRDGKILIRRPKPAHIP